MNEEIRLKAEIHRLQRVVELQRLTLDRYGPCSDHNGKVKPLSEWECQWCRAERAERKVARLLEQAEKSP